MKEFADKIRGEITVVLESGQTGDNLSLIALLGNLAAFRRTIITCKKSGDLTKEEADELENFRADKYTLIRNRLTSD